jgi:serine/threonine protein kinase
MSQGKPKAEDLGSIAKQGYCTKQSGPFKVWSKRWFVLRGSWLLYYANPKGRDKGQDKGRINISLAKVIITAPECKRQPAYKISIPGVSTYYIVAPTPDEAQSWIAALENVRHDRGPSSSSRALQFDDFEVIRLIGRGTYGDVQLVRSKRDGQLYAMKVMSKRLLAEHQQVEQTLIEKAVLIETVHPFLVGAHYTFQTDNHIFMVLDYVPGGELFRRLKEEERFSENRSRLYAAEILLGLGHLHSRGFVYRDLKAENILVDADGHLRLTDFGLVKTRMENGGSTTTFCGTPEYIAPEMLQRKPYTKAVDWWSFGILLYEMLTGLPPFYDENTNRMYRSILKDAVPIPPNMSFEAQNLILKLLEKDPANRLGAGPLDYQEIQQQPFFEMLNWEAVLKRAVQPEWVPIIRSETDTSNFDDEFTKTQISAPRDEGMVASRVQSAFNKFTYVAATPL